ncbi:MAG: T9SS type A sorting domain-containing protein [Ignavibacteriales bacterium]|nr:T9SS type A sorting domain-containing protein [Ignavibacteriales bacterium]
MKRHLLVCILFLLMISILSGLALAQTQTGTIKVVGVPDRFKSANKNQATYGLKTVGVGSRIVLAPRVYNGAGTNYADSLIAVTSATWTLDNPVGVSKPILDTASGLNGKYVYFVPDTVGDWTVTMIATTVKGTTTPVQIKVTASKFVGEGISSIAVNVPNACACHLVDPTKFTDWQKTNHATAVKTRPSDPTGHFSFNCMNCHSAGVDYTLGTGSMGFFDVAKAEGFTTIPANGPGVYDTLAKKYPNSMQLAGIQCENCHGPAGQHAAGAGVFPTPGNNKLDESLSSDVCAPCHFSSDRHGIGYAFTGSVHSVMSGSSTRATTGVYTMGSRPTNYDRILCARCHTAQGYINEAIGGKPQPIPATTTTAVYANGSSMTCATCHDPHNGSNEMQLRAKTVGDACMGCHVVRLSSSGLHTSLQGSMLVGANLPPFTIDKWNAYITAPANTAQQVQAAVGAWGGWEFPGYTYENSSHSDIKERCAKCHMASSPSYLAASASNFSKADTMMTKLGGHTFAVAYDNIAGKDTTTILNPTGCEECHGEASIDFVDLTQAKTKSLIANLFKAMPKRDSAGTSVISLSDTVAYQNWAKAPANLKRKLTIVDKAAAFNYAFVNNDGSFGVHNFNYAKGLITSSIEQLQLAAGAASIASIRDVPYDNGRKVQVVWNAFPSEQWSYSTAVNYGVWRKDPMLPSVTSVKKVSSFTEMMKATSQGSQVVMGGSVWSYVGGVPASNLPQYSYVAPTLFDSTRTSGQRWTVFYIAGYSKDNAVVYSTQPDSGYSTDNISPIAPQSVTAGFNSNTVTIKWKANTETDVYQYAIYRGTTASFDPTGTTPLAKVRTTQYQDVLSQTGVTYYYKVSAVDISGNESPYTAVSVLTGIDNVGGVPTEFALGQNYPNPFNPSTEITFAIPKQTNVKVVVYNLSGAEIATLVNQSMSAGNYRAVWNGRTDDGRTVASGVYFYHLQAEGFTATKKMTLLK